MISKKSLLTTAAILLGGGIGVTIDQLRTRLYDDEGYNKKGYDREGYNKEGYNKEGYDKEGYDRDGYNKKGYDREGYDREGYRYGYDKEGYDRDGYDREGYDKYDYDRKGYGRDGYNKDGYDKRGYNKDGYNKKGYDRKGYDKDGYDKKGYDKKGYNKEGYDRAGYTDVELENFTKEIESIIKKASGEYRAGEYDDAVGHCRKALENIYQYYVEYKDYDIDEPSFSQYIFACFNNGLITDDEANKLHEARKHANNGTHEIGQVSYDAAYFTLKITEEEFVKFKNKEILNRV